MKRLTKVARIHAALLQALLAVQPAIAASPVLEGRQRAIEDCSACHRVTKDQKLPPLVSDPEEARSMQAPPFDVIARRYAGRPALLARFIRAPLHPMREQQFLPTDLKAIVRYISSLGKERW